MLRTYGIAFAALLGAIALRWAVDPWLGTAYIWVTLYGAVAVAAWAGGWRPAVAVALGGVAACAALFLLPRMQVHLDPRRESIGFLLYVISCGVIIASGETMRRARRTAEAARQEAENEVERRSAAESRFRLAADAVNGVIYEYDFRTGIVERTRGLQEVLGWDPGEVPPVPGWWEAQIHPEDREDRQQQFAAAAAAGPRITTRYRIRHKDGRWLHVEDRAILVKGVDGRRLRLYGCTVDVTELREAEDAMRAMNAELHQADRRKDEFLATLAHELRNPLAPIRNAARILALRGAADEKAAWAQGVIERQSGHMARLLDDLLDVSRITRGKLEMRKVSVTLGEVIEAAVETSRPAIEAGGHEFSATLPAAPMRLFADPVRLAQVFSNLLNNAAKYTERGGRISITAAREGTEAVVRVADTGIGIEPEMLGRLFQMFSQAVQARERSQGGLGIGLSLARGLVELHGGRITAFSEGPGRGSEFAVHLPLAISTEADATSPGPAGGMAAGGRRVLVADDNRESADSLCALLQMLGFETCVAYDGAEAIEAAERFRPEVALLDIGMPRVDGLDACKRIRRQPGGEAVRIVVISGWGQDDDRRRTLAAGFDAHLVKPVDPGVLESLLGAARQHGSTTAE